MVKVYDSLHVTFRVTASCSERAGVLLQAIRPFSPFDNATAVQGECRAELAQAMLSRSPQCTRISIASTKVQQFRCAAKFPPPIWGCFQHGFAELMFDRWQMTVIENPRTTRLVLYIIYNIYTNTSLPPISKNCHLSLSFVFSWFRLTFFCLFPDVVDSRFTG